LDIACFHLAYYMSQSLLFVHLSLVPQFWGENILHCGLGFVTYSIYYALGTSEYTQSHSMILSVYYHSRPLLLVIKISPGLMPFVDTLLVWGLSRLSTSLFDVKDECHTLFFEIKFSQRGARSQFTVAYRIHYKVSSTQTQVKVRLLATNPEY